MSRSSGERRPPGHRAGSADLARGGAEPAADRPGAGGRILDAEDHGRVADGFRRLLPRRRGLEEHLAAAIGDVLDHPGSLLRAQLAFAILRSAGVAEPRALDLAIALEYLHTASLVFDDLPSMDDAEERRGRPCPHRTHGEAAAILAALALVNQGYALLWRVLGELPPEPRRRGAELVADCLGVDGLLDGQARDLHFDPGHLGSGAAPAAAPLEVARRKTVPLIRLTLGLPALVAGASRPTLAGLDRLAVAWGLAYQVIDDFKDCLMSRSETGKTPARDEELRRPSLPRLVGPGAALARLDELLAEAGGEVERLAAADGAWRLLAPLRRLLEAERRGIGERLALAACA